jgi:hypothetical protein
MDATVGRPRQDRSPVQCATCQREPSRLSGFPIHPRRRGHGRSTGVAGPRHDLSRRIVKRDHADSSNPYSRWREELTRRPAPARGGSANPGHCVLNSRPTAQLATRRITRSVSARGTAVRVMTGDPGRLPTPGHAESWMFRAHRGVGSRPPTGGARLRRTQARHVVAQAHPDNVVA